MAGGSKKSKASEPEGSYQPGDVVLAKVKGYPPWPAIICDESNVPSKVKRQKNVKGAWTVRFFPAADYGWAKGKELSKLTKREIQAYIDDPHKKAADLKDAYRLALDPDEWNEEQNEIVRNAEQEAQQEADEAKEGVDELADDDEGEGKAGAKRKRASEKKKGTAGVRESAEAKNKKKKIEAVKSDAKPPHSADGSHAPRKSAGAEDADDDGGELDPETKKVKSWRHALQRGFLTKDGAPINEAGMEAHDETFKAVEAYTQITSDQLKKTKIGKVMKRIVGLTEIPRDSEFHFRERAGKLCEKWGEVMAHNKPADSPAKDLPAQDSAAPNGDAKKEGASEGPGQDSGEA